MSDNIILFYMGILQKKYNKIFAKPTKAFYIINNETCAAHYKWLRHIGNYKTSILCQCSNTNITSYKLPIN